MFQNILVHLQFTPFFVYTTFIVLLYYGIVSCVPHEENTRISLIIALIVLIVYSYKLEYFLNNFWYWLSTFIIGGFLGFIEPLQQKVKILKKNIIFLSGHWLKLFIFIIIFSGHYYLGAVQESENLFHLKHTENIIYSLVAGLASSYFLLQSLSYMRIYKNLVKQIKKFR